MILPPKYCGSALLVLALCLFVHGADAEFAPSFLQNASYWRDGKSEIDFYSADFVRDGQHYQTELLMVFTPEFIDPTLLTRADNPKQNGNGTLPVIRMHQAAVIPRGLLIEQKSLDALWRMDFMSLARLTFAGSDGLGDVFRSLSESREGNTISWKYTGASYRSKAEKTITPSNGTVIFYDELPLRVRTIDFTKPNGNFEIELARTLVNSRDEEIIFKPATVSYKVSERAIDVEVKQDSATDQFRMDRDFPFLLREWKASDGSQLKLKNSIKADFASYSKPGDRERALKDPMLRHPD
jgi:hypothetical protein